MVFYIFEIQECTKRATILEILRLGNETLQVSILINQGSVLVNSVHIGSCKH